MITSRDSAGALTRRTRDAVPASEFHIGELRDVSSLSILVRLTVSAHAVSRQHVFALVFVLGQV